MTYYINQKLVFQKKKTSHKARCNKIKLTGTSLTKAVAIAVPSEMENGTQLISGSLAHNVVLHSNVLTIVTKP
jgi:hypothetical protein